MALQRFPNWIVDAPPHLACGWRKKINGAMVRMSEHDWAPFHLLLRVVPDFQRRPVRSRARRGGMGLLPPHGLPGNKELHRVCPWVPLLSLLLLRAAICGIPWLWVYRSLPRAMSRRMGEIRLLNRVYEHRGDHIQCIVRRMRHLDPIFVLILAKQAGRLKLQYTIPILQRSSL